MQRNEAMRAARKRAGLTIIQLSDLSGVSKGNIGLLERGEIMGNIVTIELLADALGITIDEYVGHKTAKERAGAMEEVELTMDSETGEYTAKQGLRVLGTASTLAEITDIIRCCVEYG